MVFHNTELTFSDPEDMTSLHFGHFGLYLIASRRHRRQKLCPQGVVQGLMQISRQIEQVNSSFSCFRSTPALPTGSDAMRAGDRGREKTPVLALVAMLMSWPL